MFLSVGLSLVQSDESGLIQYTYYALTALNFRIPAQVKRSLTTMQITQFVVGTLMASSYLFVSYTLPVPQAMRQVVDQVASAVPAAASAVSPSGTAMTASAAEGLIPWLKKLALRAAGAEGIAENVGNAQTDTFGNTVTHAAKRALSQHSSHPSIAYPIVTCMDTTGQGFAIWLNVMYLLPLTYLFARFFVRSYLQRKEPGVKPPTHMHAAEKAGLDALKGVSREIHKAVVDMHGDGSEVNTEDETATRRIAQPLQNGEAEAARQADGTTTAAKDEGFSPVSHKKGARQIKKEHLKRSPPAQSSKEANPFEVLESDA